MEHAGTKEQLAIIRRPRVEVEDHSLKPALMFDAFVSEGYAALQIVPLPEVDIPGLKWDVSALEGKPCWVKLDKHMILFTRWWKE